MALISKADVVLAKSAVVAAGATNGGRMAKTVVGGGVVDSLFPSASTDERTAGSTTYRKGFHHNRNAADETAYNFKAYLENYTPGGDEIVFFAATQTDVQGDITGSEDLFGVGQLNADITPGDESIAVSVHDWANLKIFRAGVLLRISDKATISDPGNTEFVEVHASDPITAAGNVVTIPLASPVGGSYSAANTRVASVMQVGHLTPAVDGWSETAAGTGTYDESTYPVGVSNQGTVEQSITVTFTSATEFDVTSDVLGALGSGDTSTDFEPTNADFSAPYFTLLADGWAGVWQAGDTVVFDTHPAAAPLWFMRDIPAATGAQSGNKAVVAWRADSN